MEQIGSHWTDFHEIWYMSIFRKSAEEIKDLAKYDDNNEYFTWRPTHIYDHSSLSSSLINVSDIVEKIEHKLHVQNIFKHIGKIAKSGY
jgi:hypothetical protein